MTAAGAWTRRVGLCLGNALAIGMAPILLGRRRLGLGLLAAYVTIWAAYAAIDVWLPPLDWNARQAHLALVWLHVLMALGSLAWLLGHDAERVERLPFGRAIAAPLIGLGIAFGFQQGSAALARELGALEYRLLVPEDNAGAPNFPEGHRAVVMMGWWERHPVQRGDLVWLMAEDLPENLAEFRGPTRVMALPGDRFSSDARAPWVNGQRIGARPLGWPYADLMLPHPTHPDDRRYRMEVSREIIEGRQPHRIIRFVIGSPPHDHEAGSLRTCDVLPGRAVVLRDNRVEGRPAQDSRAGYARRHPDGRQIFDACPTTIPLSAIRHRPTTLAYTHSDPRYRPVRRFAGI